MPLVGPVTAKACEMANASGTAQDQRGGRGAVLAGRHALRRSAPQDGVAEPGFPPLGTGVGDRKRVLWARWPFRTPSRSQGLQGNAPGDHAPQTFPSGVRGRPNRRHLSAFAGMAGAIGLLLLSGCGSPPRWFASTSRVEQQQELRRMDEQHLMLMQRLEQRVQRLDERQRRLDQQTRRLSGWRRAREKEQRLLQVELGKLELKREREQQQ